MTRILGFFDEFWPMGAGEHTDGSIRDFVSESAAPAENTAAVYLQNGRMIFATMGVTEDIFGSGEVTLGGSSIFTDGEWIWRGDLVFYLEYYHIRLPIEFMEKVRSSTADPSDVSKEKLQNIMEEVDNIISSPKRNAPSIERPPVDWNMRFPTVQRLACVYLGENFPLRYSSHREAISSYISETSRENRAQLVEELRILLRLASSDSDLESAADTLGMRVSPPSGVGLRQWLRDVIDIMVNVS